MKTLRTSAHIDLDLATPRPTGASFATTAVARLVKFYRALKNRRAVMHLEDFTDQQLADIGLSREDLGRSLSTPWYDDPSAVLTQQVRRRRGVPPRVG